MNDQAERLREIALSVKQQIETEIRQELKVTRVIVVSSGKGGVGKSTLALNVSINLCSRGQRVLLMDADMGMANIDIMLGLVPKYNIQHVVQGNKSLKDIIISGPEGLSIIPGSSGMVELANLPSSELQKIMVELGKLDGEYDYLVIDTGAGISRNVLTFLLAADDVVIITTPEPPALTDAYGVVKAIARESVGKNLYLVVNRVNNNAEGIMVAEKFKMVCFKFLGLEMKILGHVVNDPLVGEGIRSQQAFSKMFPYNVAAKNINDIAGNLISANPRTGIPSEGSSGGIRKFFRKIVELVK